MKKDWGFSLLELMLAVAIAGILMNFAIPVYTQHFMHAKRLEAEVGIMQLAAALERYFVVNNTYAGASLAGLNFPSEIASGRYRLKIAELDGNSFSLQAEPMGKQTEDSCGVLMVNSLGVKSGSTIDAACW